MFDYIKLSPERTFRRTPGVHFADIGVPGSNGIDLVEHNGPSVSPPLADGAKQWYVHKCQTDNNRVIRGHRLFELYNPAWAFPHWFVFLDENSGALEIPPGCLHRSYSGNEGSVLLNHAIRTDGYDENTEFIPVQSPRWRWAWTRYHNCSPRGVELFISTGELPCH